MKTFTLTESELETLQYALEESVFSLDRAIDIWQVDPPEMRDDGEAYRIDIRDIKKLAMRFGIELTSRHVRDI